MVDRSIVKYDDRAQLLTGHADWRRRRRHQQVLFGAGPVALGYPDRALRLSRETLMLAREINHSFSLEYALHHSAWFISTAASGGNRSRW
jgi:hypothetical protein